MAIEITPQFYGQEGEEEEEEKEIAYAGITHTWLLKEVISLSTWARMQALMKYTAATKIQSFIRGWKVRQRISYLHGLAIKIQKTFRGFLGRKRYFRILEDTLRQRINSHYYKSATLIQATFRGYYLRKYTHDQGALKKLQLQAACELLQCISIKTRKQLKSQQVPGILSLRNSQCLSKVEKLLATLRIRGYNDRVRKERTAEVRKLSEAFQKSMESKYETQLPFGPDCGRGRASGKVSQTELRMRPAKPIYINISTCCYAFILTGAVV